MSTVTTVPSPVRYMSWDVPAQLCQHFLISYEENDITLYNLQNVTVMEVIVTLNLGLVCVMKDGLVKNVKVSHEYLYIQIELSMGKLILRKT